MSYFISLQISECNMEKICFADFEGMWDSSQFRFLTSLFVEWYLPNSSENSKVKLKRLTDSLKTLGYGEENPPFYVQSYDMKGIEHCVTEEMLQGWHNCWRKKHEEFEKEIIGTPWSFLSNKLFYIWDGNHRYKAWYEHATATSVIEETHLRVKCFLLEGKDHLPLLEMSFTAINQLCRRHLKRREEVIERKFQPARQLAHQFLKLRLHNHLPSRGKRAFSATGDDLVLVLCKKRLLDGVQPLLQFLDADFKHVIAELQKMNHTLVTKRLRELPMKVVSDYNHKPCRLDGRTVKVGVDVFLVDLPTDQ